MFCQPFDVENRLITADNVVGEGGFLNHGLLIDIYE